MLRRITLENFMSHQHTVIDLADGLTVLTGPNNCGKSAVVAALQILASNGKTTHVMRHGAQIAKITAETDDGHVICWQRKKASVSYTLDGEEIHRVGQGIPEGLHALLRMPVVEADAGKAKVSYDIHFGEQKSPVFLLGDPGSRAASFFAAASDASRLLEMTLKHRSNVKDQRQNAKRLTTELDSCQEELTRLQPVEELETRLNQAELEFNDISQAIGRCQQLSLLRDGIQQAATAHEKWSSELKTLKNLVAPPPQHNSAALATLIGDVSRLVNTRATAVTAIETCGRLEAPPELHPASDCKRCFTELTTTTAGVTQLASECAIYRSLEIPPIVHPTAELKRAISELQQVTISSQRATQEVALLSSLQPPESQQETMVLRRAITELNSQQQKQANADIVVKRLEKLVAPESDAATGTLQTFVQDLQSVEKSRTDLQKNVDECRKLLSDCETQVRKFVDSHPRCVTCGAKMDPDQLLAAVPGMEGHGHG